jgi:mRNA m6A methyltransferase catalytic subunit
MSRKRKETEHDDDDVKVRGVDVNSDVSRWCVDDLRCEVERVKRELEALKEVLGAEAVASLDAEAAVEDVDYVSFKVPEHAVPIRADVRDFDWTALAEKWQFDAIVMDPPWQLAGARPTRGVALGYDQLRNEEIESIPIPLLQQNGFLFVWVINSRYSFALELFERWGYKLVDEIVWVKSTVNRRLAKGHGYYLQHAKEVCLVGKKGDDPPGTQLGIASDVIFAERRGQSQKPEELYEIIETLLPTGSYLEIFGRRNNCRSLWTTIGNEL